MTGFVRKPFSRVLVALVVLGAISITPDTVLCVGPGNHCHLEAVVGASRGKQEPRATKAVPRDHCPKGSKDIRVSFPARRSDNHFTATAFVIALAVSPALVSFLSLQTKDQAFRDSHTYKVWRLLPSFYAVDLNDLPL